MSGRDLDRRRAFIDGYSFPPLLRETLGSDYEPALSDLQTNVVLDGLRTWFLACLFADGKTIGMPSKAVDDAWHDFILMTRDYHDFCGDALGYYLHHTPHGSMHEPLAEALRRTLETCERHPELDAGRLGSEGVPFLFAVDSVVGLEDGYHWSREDIDRLRRGGWAAGGGCGGDGCGGDSGSSCSGGSCGGGSCGGGG